MYKVAVLTTSDKCSTGDREDKSGKIVCDLIKTLPADIVQYDLVPDEPEQIKAKLIHYCDELKVDLALTTGGTGFTPRDLTPEATREVIEREVPGIPEAMRCEGFKITKRAMLSRGIAGLRGKTLIINLPGSTRGAQESLEAVLDELGHGLKMLEQVEH